MHTNEGDTHNIKTNNGELSGVTPSTFVHSDELNTTKVALNIATDIVSPENAEMEGVTSTMTRPNDAQYTATDMVTPTNADMEGVTPIMSSTQATTVPEMGPIVKRSVYNSHVDANVVTLENGIQNEKKTILPDLVTEYNKSPTLPVLPAVISTNEAAVTPANAGEFDFPALSSEEDNGLNTLMVAPVQEHVNEQMETQLTEEEGGG